MISAPIKAAFLLPELMDHHYKTEHDSELIFTMMGIMAEDSNGAGGGNGKQASKLLDSGGHIQGDHGGLAPTLDSGPM